MNKEFFENKSAVTQDIKEKETGGALENYQRYLELGGIINEKDYQNTIDRMNKTHTFNRTDPRVRNKIWQAEGMARYARIELNNSEDDLDPKIVLYVILRSDVRPEGVEYHHSQMSDQCIFGEVLRMLGDADSLDKLVRAYPNISFKYKREE